MQTKRNTLPVLCMLCGRECACAFPVFGSQQSSVSRKMLKASIEEKREGGESALCYTLNCIIYQNNEKSKEWNEFRRIYNIHRTDKVRPTMQCSYANGVHKAYARSPSRSTYLWHLCGLNARKNCFETLFFSLSVRPLRTLFSPIVGLVRYSQCQCTAPTAIKKQDRKEGEKINVQTPKIHATSLLPASVRINDIYCFFFFHFSVPPFRTVPSGAWRTSASCRICSILFGVSYCDTIHLKCGRHDRNK